MKVEIISPQPTSPKLTTDDMKVGEIGILRNPSVFGLHVLKTFDCLVSLEDPDSTWEGDAALSISSILAKGTVLKLTL